MNGISDILRRYATSLEGARALMPQLTEAVKRERALKPPTAPRLPQYFTAEEVSGMGLTTEAGEPFELEPGWMLRVIPGGDGVKPSVSQISPTGWEITQELYISPEGKRYTPEEYEAELARYQAGYIWDYATGELVPATKEQIAEREALYAKYPEIGPPGTPGKITPEEFEAREAAQRAEIEKVFGKVFPTVEDAGGVLDWVAESEENLVTFLELLERIGRDEDTEVLLQKMFPTITEEQKRQLFGQPAISEREALTGNVEARKNILRDMFRLPEEEIELLYATGGTRKETEAWARKYISPKIAGGWVDKIHQCRTGIYAPMGLSEKAQLSLAAGIGDVFSSAGGAAAWLGMEDTAAELAVIGTGLERRGEVPSYLVGEGWSHLIDPEFYATTVSRALPFSLSLLPLMFAGYIGGTAVATALGIGKIATFLIGAFSGAALSRPAESAMEAGEAYNDAIAHGKTEKEASEIAKEVFTKNCTLLGLDALQIAIALAPTPKWVPLKLIGTGLVTTVRVGGKMVIIGLSEGGEEILQDIFQRQARGEEWHWDPISKEVFSVGLVMGMGMGLGGDVVASAMNKSKADMSPSLRKDFDDAVSGFEKAGFTTSQAELKALDVIAQTPEGEKVVQEAIEATKAKPRPPVIPKAKPGIPEAVPTVKPPAVRKPPTVPKAILEAEEVALRISEMEMEVAGLKEWLATEPAAKLVDVIKKTGWYKGEVSNLTLAQYKKLTGKAPLANILTADKKHVRWEYALDDIATEMGYKSGDDLKVAIERAGETMAQIKELEAEIAVTEIPVAKEISPEEQLVRERVQKVREQYKEKVATYDQVKQTLYDIAKVAPAEVRGKMLAAMKDVKTEAQLDKALIRLGELAERHDQRVLRIQVKKELRRTRAKKYEGILKGKYTPEVQKKLDIIRKNLEVDRDLAREKIADNIHAYEKGEISHEEMLEANEILNMAGIDGMSSQELKGVLENIKSLKTTGKAIREEARAKEKERIDAIKTDVIGVITGGKGLKPGIGTIPARELEATKGWLEKLVNWQYSLTNLMDKLSKFHTTKPYQSPLSKFVDNAVMRSRDAENSGLQRAYDKIRENFSRIFKTTNRGQINQILNKFQNEEVNLGTFKNLDGEVVTLRLTKDQIMNKYQQLQDPTLEGTFIDGMRWSADIKQAVVNNLSEQEKAWADYQMEFYQEYYDSINEIYSEMFGVDLPHNLNYSPVKRDLEAEVPENVLTYKDISRYASVLNGSLKSRVANKIPLRFNGSTALLANHVQQMEHFKAWAGTMRDMRRVLGDKGVRTAIRQYHGQPILKTIDGYLNDIARGGMEKASINRGADFLRRNFVRAVLGVKPVIALKQIPSVIAYSTEMPIGDFARGVADFWTNPVGHYRFMLERSPYMRQRFGRGFERDIKFAMERGPARTLSGMGNAKDWFMALIRQGDKFAVTQGSWAKYKSERKVGLSEEEAMASAEMSTRRTQPTFDIETLSPLQKGGSWVRLLTMFQNQPNKYFRIMADNARNFQYGRGNRAKALSNILLVWVIAPALFQFIADAFQFKKEHQLRAWVLGPLNWVLIFSQFAQSVYGWVTDEPYDYQASPVFQTGRDIQIAIMKAMKLVRAGRDPYENINMDDAIAMAEYFAKAAGQLLGYPTPWLVQAERGIREGEPLEIIFSRWSLRKPEKDDRGKALDAVSNLGKTKLDIDLASEEVETRRKAEKEAREREEAEARGLTVEPLDIFDMGDLDNDMNRIYGDTLPDDVIADKKSPPEAVAWAEMAKSRAMANTQPDIPLYKINTDKEKDDTIIHYYKQWQARDKIDNLADLTEFDKLYPNANLGNVTRRQYDLLVKYLETPDDKKKQFVEDHPELKKDLRDEWLKANPLDNARLAVWGEAKILTLEAYNEVKRLIKQLDIPDDAIPEFTLPPEGSVENYFKYLEAGEDLGYNSWEVQLIIAQDEDLREFLGREPIVTPVASLELKVKHRDLFDQYDALGDKDSPLYIEDDDARDEARDKLRADNPEWVDDMRRIEAIEHEASDDLIEGWVERGKLVDEFSAGSSEVKVWLFDHPEIFTWALEQELLTDDGSDWNVPVLRINAEWRKEDDKYAGFGDDETEFYIEDEDKRAEARDKLLEDEDYRKDRRRRDAYSLEGPTGERFPENQIENYVAYFELPGKGYRRKRMLLEDKAFGKAMHEIKGIDLPDPKEIPAVGWDETYEEWQKSFDRFWGLADHESEYYIEDVDKRAAERDKMRFDKYGNPTEFYKAEKRLDAYELFVPEDLIPTFVEYYTSPEMEKSFDPWFKDHPTETYYGDDWFLMEHPRFCQTMVDLKIWLEPRDFSKVPTREVFQLYKTYRGIPQGAAQLNYRARFPELDAWGVLAKDWTPIGERGRKEEPKTPWEIQQELERFKELF